MIKVKLHKNDEDVSIRAYEYIILNSPDGADVGMADGAGVHGMVTKLQLLVLQV